MISDTYNKAAKLHNQIFKLNQLKSRFLSENCAVLFSEIDKYDLIKLGEINSDARLNIINATVKAINAEIEKMEEGFRKLW